MVFSITESLYETSEKMDRERKEKPWFILLWNRRWEEVMNDLLCHEMKFWSALTDCWAWESGLFYTYWLFSVDLLSYTLSPDQTTKPAPVRREHFVYMEGEKRSAATSTALYYTVINIFAYFDYVIGSQCYYFWGINVCTNSQAQYDWNT